jgi:CRP-like cAMP-binding protein
MLLDPLPTLDEVIHNPQVRRRLFRRLPLLAGVEEAICWALADAAHPIHRPKGEQVIGQGDPGHEAYFILSGLVRLSRVSESSLDTHLSYRGPSQPFGLHDMIADQPHTCTTRVVRRCHLMRLDRSVFMDCFNHSDPLRRNLFRHLHHCLIDTADKLQQTLRLRDRGGRVLGELLEILDALDTQLIAGDRIDRECIDWLGRKKLADQLGCDVSIIHHALRTLEDAELLTRADFGSVTIAWEHVPRLKAVYELLDDCNLKQAINRVSRAYREQEVW